MNYRFDKSRNKQNYKQIVKDFIEVETNKNYKQIVKDFIKLETRKKIVL